MTRAEEPERTLTRPCAWARALQARRPRRFDAGAYRRVVVVAAHPDDETLGAGGVLRALHAAGAALTLVIATDGEAAYPGSSAADRGDLGRVRRVELAAALQAQGLGGVAVHWLGLPDSGLADRGQALREALVPLLADADAYLAPWRDDPHPDHRAVGRAAADTAPVTTHGWAYPIWMWAWTDPDDPVLPWDRAYTLALDAGARAARRAGVACFTSQIEPGPNGEPAVLAAGLLEHVDRDIDLLFREPRRDSAPVGRFATLYAEGNDPWRTGSWYERRKRGVVLACLPREHYQNGFEPGCGAGELTVELAGRCDRLVACDPVPDAVERARAATQDTPGVRIDLASLPEAVPDGPAELVVFSEVLYYLDDRAISDSLDRTLDATRAGGDVVVVHWRGWPAEATRDADATHRLLRARPELDVLVEHVDEQFLLTVLRRR